MSCLPIYIETKVCSVLKRFLLTKTQVKYFRLQSCLPKVKILKFYAPILQSANEIVLMLPALALSHIFYPYILSSIGDWLYRKVLQEKIKSVKYRLLLEVKFAEILISQFFLQSTANKSRAFSFKVKYKWNCVHANSIFFFKSSFFLRLLSFFGWTSFCQT